MENTTTQILLIVVISTLTIILSMIGIQFFLILKEFKKSIFKVNDMLDDGTVITGTVAKSVSGVSNILSGIKAGLSVFNFFKKDKSEEDGAKER